MTELQFDLDTLLDLQVLYNPLKKLLEHLLLKDKLLTTSLAELEQRLSSHEAKLNSHQEFINATNVTVNSVQGLIRTHDEQITERT